MVFLGIDWAEAQHELCLTDAAGAVLARRQIPDGLAGVRQLHALVAQHAGEGAEVLVGIERDRGLLVQAVVAAGYQGSIPARTGEPVALTTRFSAGQVYPRAYGGTGARKLKDLQIPSTSRSHWLSGWSRTQAFSSMSQQARHAAETA